MCSPWVEYDDPAAVADAIAPASEIPSCSIWPCADSL